LHLLFNPHCKSTKRRSLVKLHLEQTRYLEQTRHPEQIRHPELDSGSITNRQPSQNRHPELDSGSIP